MRNHPVQQKTERRIGAGLRLLLVALLLAVQIDGRSEQEQKAAVSAAADRRRIDLKPRCRA